MWMRGGTSKGGFFLADDLPEDRNTFLLSIMGSPDLRQIDGMGGADPLTSKVAVVKKSSHAGMDVDYLFLQVLVERPEVSDAQNCGNLLAAVAPFAIERGLVAAQNGETRVAIYMENTGKSATALVQTPNRRVTYEGTTEIDGVPGQASAVTIAFNDIAGANCGALLPTGNPLDQINGIDVTLIDNGMPTVLLAASDMGITGKETRAELEANAPLKARLEAIRLQAGPLMNLGDVAAKTVPKMTMISPAQNGGTLSTRTFIPHRCHASIGVLGAVSVATACVLEGTVAHSMATVRGNALQIEHPIGQSTILIEDGGTKSAVLRTARKLFDGEVFGR